MQLEKYIKSPKQIKEEYDNLLIDLKVNKAQKNAIKGVKGKLFRTDTGLYVTTEEGTYIICEEGSLRRV